MSWLLATARLNLKTVQPAKADDFKSSAKYRTRVACEVGFRIDQQESPGDANLTLVLFDDEYLLHADRAPIKDVLPLDASTYVPRSMTALLDAIGRTIDNIGKKLAKTPEKDRPSKVIDQGDSGSGELRKIGRTAGR